MTRGAAEARTATARRPAAPNPKEAPLRGPLLLLAGIGLFTLLDANTKLLSADYPLGQVVFIRYAALLLAFATAQAVRPGFGGRLATAYPRLHLLRAAAMMVSAAAFFLAFRQLPLAEGYLVFFTAPFMTLALAAVVLHERVPRAAWAWCCVGFAGVLLAVGPRLTAGGPPLAYLAALVGTATYAVVLTVNRMVRNEAGLARVVVWPALMGVAVYGPLAALGWVAPPAFDAAMLAANGLFSGAAVVCLAAAFRHAPAARLAPFEFAGLPVAVAFDLAIWGAWPAAMTVAGGAVVVAACVMSERAQRRYGTPAGKTCRPSAPSGSGTAERSADSGKAP